ncbi:MAG: adenylate/guanylate cyclase domain-containing protein [Pseudomonadales bacterium]|nr:adenylate/guanylate cyclase domain-containing protein [Pseudomonadales bacterium]
MGTGKRRYDLITIAVVFLLAAIFEYEETFSLIEDETLSYRQILRTHYADNTEPADDILIVFTDEAFYDEYGVFPLRRVDLAKIIRRLSHMGARVIGVDMLLDFNSAYGEDPELEDALSEAGNVLLVSQARIQDGKYMGMNRAIDRFDNVTASGYSNIFSNSAISESIVRLRLYPEIAEEGEWPFAVQAVANYLGDEPRLEGNTLHIGDEITVPLDQFHDMYIDYPLLPSSGDGGTMWLHQVIGLSAADVLFPQGEGELAELSSIVKDRIVLIGEVAEVAHDEFETPVGNVYGVEVIADTITTLLRNGPLRAAGTGVEVIVALLMMFFLMGTSLIASPLRRNVLSFGVLLVFVVMASWFYVSFGYVLSMSYVLIASLVGIVAINARYYLSELGQKAQIRDAFGQYLSPRVVADILKNPDKLSLGGEEREMTAYFSDIAGFSSFSEKMTPKELVQVLNDYLTEMCNYILRYEGTVDKFEGDAIIAFWGAPAIQEDHARRACFAAIDMWKSLEPMRERFMALGYPAIHVRMGLNSGPMVVGNMGSVQKMDYTVMGDTVNLASRLEGANKAYDSGIMISEHTYERCRNDVDVRELDTIRVVGKSEPVTVYQLLDRKGRTTGLMADLVVQFEKARKLYEARNFEDALAAFKLCTSIEPTDGPSKKFVARCQHFIQSPPPANWDGVFVLDEKG